MRKNTILLMTSCLVATFGCSKKEGAEAEAPAPVQVTAVTQDTIRRIVTGDGMLFPRDQASVMPKIASPVQKFYVNRGDHVKQGQLLAVLESRDLTAQAAEGPRAMDHAESNLRTTSGASVPEALVKAQTDVDADRHAMDAAKKVLDIRDGLFKEGALARRQVDEALVSYTQAKGQFEAAQEHLKVLQAVAKDEQIKTASAQVDSAKAHHQSLEAQLSYARILSPIGGVVADRPLYAGEMATPGTPLLTVMDISQVVARVNVPQNQAVSVKVGNLATITASDSGLEAAGKVIVVSPATDPSSTTVQVWVQAENPGERLNPGASVHVVIITEMFKAATVVPVAAILPGEEKGTAVLTVGADSTAHKKQVEAGVREGDKVQILPGVRPGEEVVGVAVLGVDDKTKVKVISPTVEESEEEDTPAPPEPAKK